MENITYIIPIHIFNEDVKKMIKTAIESIKNLQENEGNKIIFVGPKGVIEKANKVATTAKAQLPVSLVENDDTDVYVQINKGVMACTTKYFSVLEFDDEYTPYWVKAAKEYLSKGSVLIPINEFNIDGKVRFGNETAWAPSFSDELGYLTIDALNTFFDFNVTGAIIKTEDFISVGGLKPSLKVAAWYEFLLRACHNGLKVYVVPKIGYKHLIGRENSYSKITANISREEVMWLLKTAQQEYFFREDRKKVFEGKDSKADNE